ncbi:MAG: hypothetical protein KDK33_11950, partial [Leptospiraceae bacterium]|nr:hypothetical protein [Leptospiraceae bacterium]
MKTATESTDLQQQIFEEFKEPSALRRSDELSYQYLEAAFDRPPFPAIDAIRALDQFEEPFPDSRGDAASIIEQLHALGSPATVSGLGGRYFGFGVGSALPVGLAAKRMTTVWDQVPAMEVLSPVASRLESVVEGWLVDLLALPAETAAGFVSGSAVANLCALAAARRHQLGKHGWDVNEKGLAGSPRLRIVAGAEAHSTAIRALSLLGFGKTNIEWIPTD